MPRSKQAKKISAKPTRQVDWKEKARTFETRRFIAELNLDNVSKADYAGMSVVEAELRSMGVKETTTPFGHADRLNQVYGWGFRAMRFHMWRKREIWNRLQWLRAELTRLLEGKGYRGHKRRNKTYNMVEMTREELIIWRRSQIAKYLNALDEYAPLHKAITDEKRNRRKRTRRAAAKKAKRKDELQRALESSAAQLQAPQRT